MYTRPFAVTKCSAWLVSNESPVSKTPSPAMLQSATVSQSTLLSPSTYRQHTNNTRFTKNLSSKCCGKTKQTCRNVYIWPSWECNGWQVSRHESLDTAAALNRLDLLFSSALTGRPPPDNQNREKKSRSPPVTCHEGPEGQ